MGRHRDTIAVIILALFILGGLIGLTWFNYSYVSNSSGMNDFLPRWVGVRMFMVNGWSPYSEETTKETQTLAYGHLATEGEDQGFFLYPFYCLLVFAPFALISDVSIARAIWMTFLEILIIALLFVSLSLCRWRPSKWILASLLLITLIWYHTVRPTLNGDAAIVSAFLIALGLLALRSELDALAGILLALASIKPQMVVILYILVLFWGISQKRWPLLISLFGGVLFMTIAFSLLIPTWVAQNIRQLVAFINTEMVVTPGSIIAYWLPGIGKQLGYLITFIVIIVLIVEWRSVSGKDFRWFLWTAFLTIVLTNLSGIHTSLDNYIAFLPAIILIISILDIRWGAVGRWLSVVFILIMVVGIWGLVLFQVERAISPDLDPLILLFAPIVTLIGLYWIRWWAIRPQRLPLEDMAARFE